MISDRLPPATTNPLADGKLTLRKFACATTAGSDSLNVTLFRDVGHGDVCGWFIGPLAVRDGCATLPYLPRSAKTSAAVAVVRALEAGRSAGCAVCVIDPDDLWDGVWRV